MPSNPNKEGRRMRRWVNTKLSLIEEEGVAMTDILRNALLSFDVGMGEVENFINKLYIKPGLVTEEKGVLYRKKEVDSDD